MKVSLIILFCYLLAVNQLNAKSDQLALLANNNNSDSLLIEKYKLVMELSKSTYKMYEPVLAKFILINNDTEPLEFYDLFNDETPTPHICVDDEKGNRWTENQTGLFIENFLPVSLIVQPNESLFISMPINKWGEKAEFNYKEGINEVYFGQWGFFPPGKYMTYFYTTQKEKSQLGANLHSNVVTFEVTHDSKEDNDLLMLYKEGRNGIKGKYEEIIKKYPQNTFTEHVFTEYLMKRHYQIFTSLEYPYIDSMEEDYMNFILKYPDSFYLLRDKFLYPYIYKISLNIPDINNLKSNIENKYLNFNLNNFLNNTKRIQNILSRNVY